jgi:hypothetical protein
MTNSPHQRGRLAYRTAGWAAGCLVLLVHLVVAPALPGCHCRHRSGTMCPHEAAAPRPEPTPAVEGTHCHATSAATLAVGHDGADRGTAPGAARGSHHDDGAVDHCDNSRQAPKSYRVGEPFWPVAELAEAPALAFEPAVSRFFERSVAASRALDPPLSPPPRSSSSV